MNRIKVAAALILGVVCVGSAAAGPFEDANDYGRIFDHELVAAVQRIAGNGIRDTRWKVPGVLDWSTGIYSPRVDVIQASSASR